MRVRHLMGGIVAVAAASTVPTPAHAAAAPCPASVTLWSEQAAFFFALDVSDEEVFKASLKRYYQRVYQGRLLGQMHAWIERSSLESEDYVSFYSSPRDTTYAQPRRAAGDRCVVDGVQRSCHDAIFDHVLPTMSTLVSDHMVTNVTQAQFDAWLASGTPDRRFCMTVESRISFVLADGLIVEEHHEIERARVDLDAP